MSDVNKEWGEKGNQFCCHLASVSWAAFGVVLATPSPCLFAGENDSFRGILAITLAFATPLPACVLALWKRIPAGLWLSLAGCYFPLGMLFQRVFMIYVRHFPDQDSVRQTLMISLPYSSVLIALGSFGVVNRDLEMAKAAVATLYPVRFSGAKSILMTPSTILPGKPWGKY